MPVNSSDEAKRWQLTFDCDGDGCYPTSAVGLNGEPAEGLNNSGASNGNCHDQSGVDNTNSYVRKKCDNGRCAYALYFEKD